MWKMIASADANWGIGNDNRLLVQIPRDMKEFQNRTLGQVVVMGRKTLESLPNAMALYGRENIVMTTKKDYMPKKAVVMHDIESLRNYLQDEEREVYVIGGESVYQQLLAYCDTAYITKINHSYAADAHFPNLEEDDAWELVSESEEQTYFDIEYVFQVYKRKGDAGHE